MSNFLTDDTKAIILLCGVLGKGRSVKPLTQGEYNALARWLISENMRPEDLLRNENVGSAAMGSGIDQERLTILLGRGVQLGFVVEEWQRNGIWIISRSDKDYPARYKKRLKDKAPPLLFGTGDRSLLQGGGIAIVGSRNVDADGEAFTYQTAELCVYNTIPVVSGGARGVDRIAMTAALEAGGVTIGVLAENLLKKSLERNSRNAIADGRLLLISPYHPNAHFTVGTAMSRNKLIYSMADYGLVVSADHKKGGTWAGAIEELERENSLTVFIRSGATVPLGNKNLLDLGALEWPEVKIREKLSQQLVDLAANRMEKNMEKLNQQLVDLAANRMEKNMEKLNQQLVDLAANRVEKNKEKLSQQLVDLAANRMEMNMEKLNQQLVDLAANRMEKNKEKLNQQLVDLAANRVEKNKEKLSQQLVDFAANRMEKNVKKLTQQLVDFAANQMEKNKEKLSQQLVSLAANRMEKNTERNLSLFDFQKQHISQSDEANIAEKTETPPVEPLTEDSPVIAPEYAIYKSVLPIIMNQLESPTAIDELSKTLNVSKTQLKSWIKKAVNEGKIRKLSRPVRYEKI